MKKLSILLCAFVLIFLLSGVNLKAAGYKTSWDNTKTSSFTPSDVSSENILGMHHEAVTGQTHSGSYDYGQYINEFEMKTDGFYSKLVTWAVHPNNATFDRKTIIEAAKDYEEKNPGWIVLGGINADQYYFGFGTKLGADGSAVIHPTPYYPMVSNGDKLFTVCAYGTATNVVGFTNDGSANDFVFSEGAGSFYLSVLDENGTVLKKFPVSAINQNCGSSETAVWCYHFSTRLSGVGVAQDVSTDKNLYVIEDAELAYMNMYKNGDDVYYPSNYNTNTIFAKGYISNDTAKQFTLNKGQFAIETDNAEVKAALAIGTRVKVEQFFANDAMNNVDEAVGYHSCHRQGGVDNTTTASYDTKKYSRALFGKKADGTYVLITADMVDALNSKGLNWTECNAVAEYYGVTDMYQMDGGGSVTAMTRQADGTFKVTNYPKDSGNPLTPRANFSYLFFVVRDPGIQCLDEDITHHSVKLTKKDISSNATISDIKVKLNGKQYDFNTESLLIDGLTHDTEYTIDIQYKLTIDGVTKDVSFLKTFKTKAYTYPECQVKISKINKKSVSFILASSEYSKDVSAVQLYIGDNSYFMGDKKEFLVEDLFEDQEYTYHVEYDIYDSASNAKYHYVSENMHFKTLSYELPVIEKFEESKKTDNSLTIDYKYVDSDRIVSKAYITVNGKEVETLAAKNASITIKDLDFSNNDYEIQLVLELKIDGVESVKSVLLSYKAPEKEVTPPPSEETKPAKKCGKKSAELILGLISSTTLLAFVLKKNRK